MWVGDAEVFAVILINLLPHREAARKRRQEAFNIVMFAALAAGLLVVGAIYLFYQMRIDHQQGRNSYLRSEIKVLEGQIKDVENIEQEIAALSARQKAVEDLQADRNLPVHMLNELVKQLPAGVYITGLKQENQTVTLRGIAQSQQRVSELLKNFTDNTPWFSQPQLIEIVAANIALTSRGQRPVASFTMRFQLTRNADAQKVASSGAAPAPGKK
jgi:type IV pilus assembly protein PilN